MNPLADPFAEAERILSAADEQNLRLRLMGGVAIGLHCLSLRGKGRSYRDLDFVTASGFSRPLESLFESLGYQPDKTFNKLNGASRLLFWDDYNERRVDVLVDQLDMSHTIDLRNRLNCDPRTLSLADLLLSKLQIVHISDRDLLDIAALLADHELTDNDRAGINVSYLVSLGANDWGLYRTCQLNLERLLSYDATQLAINSARPAQQAKELLRRLEESPKSMHWKLRALIGERVQWYRLPEEIN